MCHFRHQVCLQDKIGLIKIQCHSSCALCPGKRNPVWQHSKVWGYCTCQRECFCISPPSVWITRHWLLLPRTYTFVPSMLFACPDQQMVSGIYCKLLRTGLSTSSAHCLKQILVILGSPEFEKKEKTKQENSSEREDDEYIKRVRTVLGSTLNLGCLLLLKRQIIFYEKVISPLSEK